MIFCVNPVVLSTIYNIHFVDILLLGVCLELVIFCSLVDIQCKIHLTSVSHFFACYFYFLIVFLKIQLKTALLRVKRN